MLARRIAELRANFGLDLMEALRAEASSEQVLVDELGELLGIPAWRAADLISAEAQFDRLPFTECARRRCALLRPPGSATPRLVTTDPFDTDTVAWARTRFGAVTPVLTGNAALDDWLVH